MNELQMIAGCKEQKRDAQKMLYETYARKMYSICLRYSSDQDAAQDLLQDGFMKVFSNIDSYQERGSFEGWMRRIFVNSALENYRKEKQKNRFLEEYGFMQTNITETPEDELLDIENIPREEVLEMIRALPPGYRTVFNLFIFEELSHREIAHLLGINEAASRSQFFRAKTILQKKITAMLNQSNKKYNEQR